MNIISTHFIPDLLDPIKAVDEKIQANEALLQSTCADLSKAMQERPKEIALTVRYGSVEDAKKQIADLRAQTHGMHKLITKTVQEQQQLTQTRMNLLLEMSGRIEAATYIPELIRIEDMKEINAFLERYIEAIREKTAQAEAMLAKMRGDQ